VKIAFVLYDYYPFGGLQDDCLKTALAAAASGHEVHIFTRTWKGARPGNLHVHALGKSGWTNTSRNERFFEQLKKDLAPHDFDGIVAFNRVPGTDIYFAADPCYAARTRNWSWWKKLHPRHRYYLKLEKRVFDRPNPPDTLVLTEKEIESFQEFYPVDRSKFHLLPPGVSRVDYRADTAIQTRAELRKELGCPAGATVALFVGSGFRIKGLDRALKGIAANRSIVPNLEFWIVGKGRSERYAKLIEAAGVPVRVLGGRADVERFYAAADFLLHPAYSESAGKVLLEAMAHGLPVLTTDTCGYGFHIEKAGAGIVLESPFTQSSLNQALKRFIEDSEVRKSWSDSALQYAKEEDLYSCHQTAAELIGEILRERA